MERIGLRKPDLPMSAPPTRRPYCNVTDFQHPDEPREHERCARRPVTRPAFPLNDPGGCAVVIVMAMDPAGSKTDDELMRDFQGGDVGAFEELVRRYRARLYAFAESMTHDPGAADDVVQETLVTVFEQQADYIPMGRFRAWVYTIARNLCRDRFREPSPVRFSADMPLILWSGVARTRGAERWSQETERTERLERVGEAAGELPKPQREAVMLKYYHGLKLREIAEIQGCPLGTAKSRVHYGLKAIENIVSDDL